MSQKFRVWIEKRKMWGYFDIKRLARDSKMQAYVTDSKVVVQSTEKEDKKGVEIFKGDIVKCAEPVGILKYYREVVGEVDYLANVASFGVRILTGDDEVGDIVSYAWELDHFKEVEVIGNVTESPELLKAKEE
jgi:uncharacterized phage protein (TIGR01671 family)